MTIIEHFNNFFDFAPEIFSFLEEKFSFQIKEKRISNNGFYATLVYESNDLELSIIFNAREERTDIKFESQLSDMKKSLYDLMIENRNEKSEFRIFSLNLFDYNEALIKDNFRRQGEILQVIGTNILKNT